MNIPQVDYAGAMGRMGQTFQRGMSNVMPAYEADVKRNQDQESYDRLMEKVKNFDQLKRDAVEDIANSMQGQPDKQIQKVKTFIKNIKDPQQLIAMGLEYKQQLDDFEQNKGVYKTRPMFGIKAETYAKQNAEFKQKARQTELTGAVAQTGRDRFAPGQTEGQPQDVGGFTEQPIATRERLPAAATQGQMAGAPEVQELAPTTQELEQVPQFATAPTEQDIEKQKYQKQKETRLREKGDYQDAMMNYRWATLNQKERFGKKRLQLSEDKAKQASDKMIGRVKTDIDEAKTELSALKKGSPNLMGETEIDWDAINELNTRITSMENEKHELDAERKMIGALPGETRAFSPGGGGTSQPAQPRERKPLGSYYK